MSNRYEYLIEYAFDGGSGRTFTTWSAPLNNADAVLRVERSIQADLQQLRRLNIRRLQLLREWSE
jgi:hypothetical protein